MFNIDLNNRDNIINITNPSNETHEDQNISEVEIKESSSTEEAVGSSVIQMQRVHDEMLLKANIYNQFTHSDTVVEDDVIIDILPESDAKMANQSCVNNIPTNYLTLEHIEKFKEFFQQNIELQIKLKELKASLETNNKKPCTLLMGISCLTMSILSGFLGGFNLITPTNAVYLALGGQLGVDCIASPFVFCYLFHRDDRINFKIEKLKDKIINIWIENIKNNSPMLKEFNRFSNLYKLVNDKDNKQLYKNIIKYLKHEMVKNQLGKLPTEITSLISDYLYAVEEKHSVA